MRSSAIPLHRRLSFRVGLVVFAIIVVVDTLTYPVWDWLYYELTPEWNDPEFVRRAADALETEPEQQRDLAALEPFDSSDRLVMLGAIVLYGVTFALLVSFLVSRMTTHRIGALSRQAARPPSDEEDLPGPFSVSGDDEIHLLGKTMESMRERNLALLNSLRAQDTHRRELIAEVSHDLRTPMAALSFSIDHSRELIEKIEPSASRDELERQLSAARLDATRVLELSADLLEVARLDAGGEPTIEPVPPGELLRTAVDELTPLAEGRGVTLTVSYPTGLGELQADGRLLIRALENVILNSIQHARSKVEVSAWEADRAFVVRVEDDGPGFGAAGGEPPTQQRASSSGIGLKVVHRIIEAHRGALTFETGESGGARLTIELPRHPAD